MASASTPTFYNRLLLTGCFHWLSTHDLQLIIYYRLSTTGDCWLSGTGFLLLVYCHWLAKYSLLSRFATDETERTTVLFDACTFLAFLALLAFLAFLAFLAVYECEAA